WAYFHYPSVRAFVGWGIGYIKSFEKSPSNQPAITDQKDKTVSSSDSKQEKEQKTVTIGSQSSNSTELQDNISDSPDNEENPLFRIKQDEKWGFIDKKGNVVINPQFEYVAPFSEGLAAIKVGYRYGYIDKSGKIVIEPKFGI